MKEIKKYYLLPASPDDVYTALTNPFTIQLWSGDMAEMSPEAGSEFSMFDGHIVGKNLEFDKNKRIVQQWYFGDQVEPSIVTIKLHPHTKGTSVELHHINIPAEAFDDISEGWDQSYFALLSDFYSW